MPTLSQHTPDTPALNAGLDKTRENPDNGEFAHRLLTANSGRSGESKFIDSDLFQAG